jgi:hypothetical protein
MVTSFEGLGMEAGRINPPWPFESYEATKREFNAWGYKWTTLFLKLK